MSLLKDALELPASASGAPPEDSGAGERETATDSQATPVRGTRMRWFDRRRLILLAASVVVLVLVVAVVIYCIGPLVHDRDQRSLISHERAAITNAAHDNEGLYRETLPTQPPALGSVVGILAIPAVGLQQAVVEGVGPSQTTEGPGHVPGTAGLGQPGNAAIVGRRAGYGGPFGNLDDLRDGDRIVTATIEGESLYIVRSVRDVTLTTPGTAATQASGSGSGASSTAIPATATTEAQGGSKSSTRVKAAPTETVQKLYGATSTNQLTLVTSGSATPWNTAHALVVVARMQGQPYTPTPQESLSPSQHGNSGDSEALGWLLLSLLGLAATFLGAVALYRRTSLRSAYLLSTAPVMVLAIFAAEAASRLLPAWL